ncbi:MAG: 1,2-phenylacetyl-CoA epoxidase subunit PaaD [Myxococcota bacterium]
MVNVEKAWDALREVNDPELPTVSIVDLGIVRDVRPRGESVEVDITPTYSGCPAQEVIEQEAKGALGAAGFANPTVNTVLSPAWSTDWITPEGRAALKALGIAPPQPTASLVSLPVALVNCPLCGSDETERLSEFGSTACKALYRCRSCLEPFDYFKPH